MKFNMLGESELVQLVDDFAIDAEVSLVEFLAGEMKRYTILFMKKRKKRVARRKRSRRTS